MKRIQPDEARSLRSEPPNQVLEVSKIPDTPITARANRVELNGDAPKALSSYDCGRFVTEVGRDDD